MRLLVLLLFSQTVFALESHEYSKLANALLTDKLKNQIEFDWTDSLLTLSIARSKDTLDIKENLVKKVKKFYRQNEVNPVEITSPDLLASVLGAIEFNKHGNKFKKTIQSGYRFLISEPRNEIGTLNHIGSRHRFSSLLPLTKNFVDDSLWADSAVMYVIPAMMIGKMFKDKKLKSFARSQLSLFEKYLKDNNGLYKHAYFLEDKVRYPEGEYYWLRGNAWILFSLIELIELESDKDLIKEYQKQFVQLYNQIILYQKDNGLFNTILTQKEIHNYEDSAGNALILYAFLKANRLGFIKTDNITKKLYKALFKKIKFKSDFRAELTEVSGPTNAFKYYWYYTWLVGTQSNLGYGLGPFILALNELELKTNNDSK
tara:strand:+ start:160092 stop:161210 length:1119 start_codon:yes stop_codon:yes gene_type:complete